MLPVMTDGPVQVMAEPASTAKLRAVPNRGWVAANAPAGQAAAMTAPATRRAVTIRELFMKFRL
jgi:hypothetical protein